MAESAPKHPSPKRYKLSWLSLLISLAGAPLSWVALMSLSYIITSYSCTQEKIPAHLDLALYLISFICLVTGSISLIVAYKACGKTIDEAKGDKKRLVDVGEGRAQFLAMLGILASGLFIIAIIFTSASILLVYSCAN